MLQQGVKGRVVRWRERLRSGSLGRMQGFLVPKQLGTGPGCCYWGPSVGPSGKQDEVLRQQVFSVFWVHGNVTEGSCAVVLYVWVCGC